MSAWTELHDSFAEGETIEAIVFGPWGWDGYNEPTPPPIPAEYQGRVLTAEEAEPLMQSWNICGGYGAPDAYSFNAWTNLSVYWITQYDGATGLSKAPRHPIAHTPSMPGG